MAGQWAQDLIDGYAAKGMLEKEVVLERLNNRIESSYTFGDEGWPALRDTASGDDGHFTRTAFISFHETKACLPRTPAGTRAGGIIFSMLAYLSTLPFPSEKDISAIGRLSFAQLTRALMWLFPDRYRGVIEESNHSRMRTAADHRRLLFQSLASITPDGPDKPPYNPSKAHQLALRNSVEVSHGMFLDLCQPNHDDNGDEIYHDLLEVLYSTQEERAPWLATAPCNAFRPIAKELAAIHNLDGLYDLGIPADRFAKLVNLLLALQFKPAEGQAVDIAQFKTVAEFTARGFTPMYDLNRDESLITWPMFDRAQKVVTPYLFDPLYKMLSLAFMDTPGT